MLNMTKFALRRPVTVILCLVTLIFFGLQSVMGSKLELTPEMEMPVLLVGTVYAGASPQDINDLVGKEIEDAVATLEGIDKVSSYAMENISLVILKYNYGTNMDTAYMNLKKAIDGARWNLPEDAEESSILEMDMNAAPVMTLAVSGGTDRNLYNYVDNEIVPEFEKLSSVGDISIAGGRENYVRIELLPEQLETYGLNLDTVAQIVGAANFTIPAGDTTVGRQSLNVSVGNDYDQMERLREIPIPLASGDVIHLSDVANVYEALKDADSIGRYDGRDAISVSIQKQQSASAVDVSEQVMEEIDNLRKKNPNLEITVINDSSDMIKGSLKSVVEALLLAVVLSMLVLFLFFGDWKASLIVGSSIPISVVLSLILMSAMGFSLNVISVGGLTLGVGMMVDNSIVVLESCFRAKEGRNYYDAAVEGARMVLNSVTGSTATTCVVFLPLALIAGLSGQMFKPLGFTIIFCMLASLFSAATVVPLCYTFLHPEERTDAPVNMLVKKLQSGYRSLVKGLLPKKKTVVFTAVALLVLSFLMASRLSLELMPVVDEGIVSITVKTKPGLTVEENNKILAELEELVANDEDVDHYLLTYGASGLSISAEDASTLNAYLKDDRKRSTEEVISKWKQESQQMTDCTVTMESGSTSGMSGMSQSNVEIDLQGTDYDDVKASTDGLVEALRKRSDITKVHSSIENAAPLVKVSVDSVKAQAEGLTPSAIGGTVYHNLSGVEAMDLTVDGEDVKVKVEFGPKEYDTINKLGGMLLTTPRGNRVPLSELADIRYEDSPQSIVRTDKQYQVSITAEPVEAYRKTAAREVKAFVNQWDFPIGVGPAPNQMDETMAQELGALGGAIGTAVFLIFVVMAAQFESPKFSLMVMFTIPFSLIGAFGLLFLADCNISMTSMLGFLMMIGTVVNNGILYVDTVNQIKLGSDLRTALVEAGTIRMRPILMTTLTTVLSMIPLGIGFGESGEMLQGLALVNIGGLVASTVLALLLLPTFYEIVNGFGRHREERYNDD